MKFTRNNICCFWAIVLVLPVSTVAQEKLQNTSPFGLGPELAQIFSVPAGYHRITVMPQSFAGFLRRLPLHTGRKAVRDYRGQIFKNVADSTVAAIVNLHIRGKKLEQCMDIIQRLYAEFCLQTAREDSIRFLLPDRSILSWKDWKQGWRPQRKSEMFPLKKNARPDRSRRNFEAYLWEIFYYSGTQTAYFGLQKVEPQNIRIGDLIIKQGRRGHAVILLDLAENDVGDKKGIFGQGDTPACEFYILKNRDGLPWFDLNFNHVSPNLPIGKKMLWTGLRRF